MQTPPWILLAVAAIGTAGTVAAGIFGVLITQRRSDRREDKIWTRERERERERWEREDRARTFEHRRHAYVDFFEALRAMELAIQGLGEGRSDLKPGWQQHASSRLARMNLYAPPPVVEAATTAYKAACLWGDGTTHGGYKDRAYAELRNRYSTAAGELQRRTRADLHVPDLDKTDDS